MKVPMVGLDPVSRSRWPSRVRHARTVPRPARVITTVGITHTARPTAIQVDVTANPVVFIVIVQQKTTPGQATAAVTSGAEAIATTAAGAAAVAETETTA
jgi:hypothetical protein